jgi:hypothetical protein
MERVNNLSNQLGNLSNQLGNLGNRLWKWCLTNKINSLTIQRMYNIILSKS